MKPQFLAFPIFLIGSFLVTGCGRSVRPEVQVLADSIAMSSNAEGPFLGMMPHHRPSELYGRFLRIADSASTPELIELSWHANPVVRYYSLKALASRDDQTVLPCLTSHLQDTARVTLWFFDVGGTQSIAEYVADEFLHVYLYRTPLKKLDYVQIRELAASRSVPSALFALARFQRVGDIEFLRGRIRETTLDRRVQGKRFWEYSCCGLDAINQFPTSAFYPILEESVDTLLHGATFPRAPLMHAIAQYPADSAYVLLDRILHYAPRYGYDKKGVQVQMDLVMALMRSDDYGLTKRFAKKLTLSAKDYVSCGRLAVRDAEYWRAP